MNVMNVSPALAAVGFGVKQPVVNQPTHQQKGWKRWWRGW